MTTEKLTDDMMQSVQSEQTGANNDAPMEQSSEKPVKQKKVKQKRKYKTKTPKSSPCKDKIGTYKVIIKINKKTSPNFMGLFFYRTK